MQGVPCPALPPPVESAPVICTSRLSRRTSARLFSAKATGRKCPAQAWSTSLPPSVLRRVPAVAFCPAPLLGAVSRRRPSNSKSTCAGSNPSRALATTKTRRRRWATPKNWASRTRQAIALWGPYTQPASFHFPPGGCSSLLSPASAPRKQPKALSLELRTPGTFSQTVTTDCFPRRARAESMASARST